MIKSIDLIAKLLATENISIQRNNASTASFDVVSRVLTIPAWKNITSEIEAGFVAHEVGHALFTGTEWMEAVENETDNMTKNALKSYINVIEDARIEKLMKRRFPGIRKTFYTAYSQLQDRDFFKIADTDVNTMMLIDKINLYFKCDRLQFSFNEVESSYVERIEKVETIHEVIALAKELLEYTKQQFEDEQKEHETAEQEFVEGDEANEANGETIDSLENSNEQSMENSSPDAPIDQDLQSKTDKTLNESLMAKVDTDTIYRYYTVSTEESMDTIVPYKQILKEIGYIGASVSNTKFKSFMTDSERNVSYLVKEFEMRKSAQAYKRAKISKSGVLNTNKLHAYKLTDDIFKKVMSIPNGKNHGMVFLLDWSGSMRDCIEDTIKQLINLVMFCRRINIPFEVYAFSTSRYHIESTETHRKTETLNSRYFGRAPTIYNECMYRLINVFSSKMTKAEFELSCKVFTSNEIFRKTGYSLNSTPLNDSLIKMLSFIPKFKRDNNIEKLTFITLTDGASDPAKTNFTIRSTYWDNANAKSQNVKNVINDEITKKSYELHDYTPSVTEALIKMIKDRYDVTILGFYISNTDRSSIYNVLRDHNCFIGKKRFDVTDIRSAFNKDGFYSLKNTGRDDLFIIPSNKTSVEYDLDFDVDEDDSAAKIARTMTKTLTKSRTSRVLLNKFIGYVA